jgi:hypothetical protein
MEAPSQTRLERYRVAIQSMVLSRLSVSRVQSIRKEYAGGRETIAEFSQRTNIPPVLLWVVLNPLHEKTQIKYKLLSRETRIFTMLEKSKSVAEIVKTLAITEKEVADYTSERFAPVMYRLRVWYSDRPVSLADESGENWLETMKDILPPTSRIGHERGELRAIPANKLGRCSTCGRLVHIPCYSCIVEEYVKNNDVPRAEEVVDEEEDDEILPSLMFR